jgi:large subunit ribosomal protein L25
MSEDKLSLQNRTIVGKKTKTLRKQGLITSVIYGADHPPTLTQSEYNPTEKVLLHVGYHSPLTLTIAGKNQMAMVKTIDIDPVKRTIKNIEFQAISADEIVEATTPIRLINFDQSAAAKLHLATLQVLEEIDIKAKPAALPKSLPLDCSSLATTEDRLTIADLTLPTGVELADKELAPDTVIVSVFDPSHEAALREAEASKEEPAPTEPSPTEPAPTPEQ